MRWHHIRKSFQFIRLSSTAPPPPPTRRSIIGNIFIATMSAGGTAICGFFYYGLETIIGNCRTGNLSRLSELVEELPPNTNFDELFSKKDFISGRTPIIGAIESGNVKLLNYLMSKTTCSPKGKLDKNVTQTLSEFSRIRSKLSNSKVINSGVIISILQIENVNVRCEMFDIIMAALPSDFTLPPYDLPLLHYFIENREENLSMQWINKHHDVMEQLYANERPLEGALRQQLFNLASFMVDRGVDVDFIDENEDTVLHRWLKEGGYARPPERIVTKFANSKNILGATPLVYTILYENSKMFQFLVDKTDLTLTSNEGMTPLHFAAIKW